MKYFFLLLFIFGCAEAPIKKHHPVVNNFIQSWIMDFGPFPEPEISAFRSYLESIESFYEDNTIANKFTNYLSTLNNNFQLVAHLEMNLPARFKKHYGHWPARKSPNYLRYQNEQTAELRKKLETTRQERLRFDLGDSLYENFKSHAAKINRQGLQIKLAY